MIETSFCALKWVHEITEVPNPLIGPFVKNIVEGAKRLNMKPVAWCTKYEHSTDLPIHVGRDIFSIVLLLFAGCFCFSEIADLSINSFTMEAPMQQPMAKSQIDAGNTKADGVQRMLKTVTSRNPLQGTKKHLPVLDAIRNGYGGDEK